MEDNERYLNELENENQALKNKTNEMTGAMATTLFNKNDDSNLIQFQLETEDILDKLQHFLTGDIITQDEEGGFYYKKQKNKDLVLLNEYGVNSFMQIGQNYINKVTILSFYDEERIYEILADLGDELNKFMLCNYEKMGLDTEFKRSRYILIVINFLHLIESAYRRAIGGKEREEINTGRVVTESLNQGMGGMGRQPSQQVKRRFNLFNPKTW